MKGLDTSLGSERMYELLNLPSVFGTIVAYRFTDIRRMYGLLNCICVLCRYSSFPGMYNLPLSDIQARECVRAAAAEA